MSQHSEIAPMLEALASAKRPLILCGWGARHAKADIKQLAALTGIPIATTWGAMDAFPESIGGFGTHGTRAANFAVQKADWILTLGTRLDTKATGSPASDFAPTAGQHVYMVDIDAAEIGKMARIGRPVHGICADVRAVVMDLLAHFMAHGVGVYGEWRDLIQQWREKYPPGMQVDGDAGVNPYGFVRELAEHLTDDDVIVSDTGCALGWMMQAYPFKGETFIHAFNNTPMGYGLPAAVGAACADRKRRVILITGDGGLSVNITEFATIARHNLNIKTILFNNYGHAMCRQTQRTWLGGTYPSTSYEGGLATPEFWKIAHAYGISAHVGVKAGFAWDEMKIPAHPMFWEIEVHEDYQLSPQVKFGHRLEDAHPLLPADELAEIMSK